jgi:hypothetical protein
MDMKSKIILALVTVIVFLSGCILYQQQYYGKQLLQKDNTALKKDNDLLEKTTEVNTDVAMQAVKNAEVSISVTKELRDSKDKVSSALSKSFMGVDAGVKAAASSTDASVEEKQKAASAVIIDELHAFAAAATEGKY